MMGQVLGIILIIGLLATHTILLLHARKEGRRVPSYAIVLTVALILSLVARHVVPHERIGDWLSIAAGAIGVSALLRGLSEGRRRADVTREDWPGATRRPTT